MDMAERIMDCALSHFFRFGFAKARVEEIAEEIGISKKTVYNHFGDKEALFHRANRRMVLEAVEEVRALARDTAKPFAQRLVAILALAVKRIGGKGSPYFADLKRANPLMGCSPLLFIQRNSLGIVSGLVDEAKADGLVRADLDTGDFSLVVLNVIDGLIAWDDSSEIAFSRIKVLGDSVRLLLQGVLTDRGRADISPSLERASEREHVE